MAVLEISITCVHEFHCDHMLKIYSSYECNLLFSNTDSSRYEIKCNDAYEEIHKFITSDYIPYKRNGIRLINKKIAGLVEGNLNELLIKYFF